MEANEFLLKKYSKKIDDLKTGDTEQDHIDADKLLCELLSKLGYNEVVEKFESLRKWYA